MGVCLVESGVAGCLEADRVDGGVIRLTGQAKTIFIAKSYIFFNASTIVLSGKEGGKRRAHKNAFFQIFLPGVEEVFCLRNLSVFKGICRKKRK